MKTKLQFGIIHLVAFTFWINFSVGQQQVKIDFDGTSVTATEPDTIPNNTDIVANFDITNHKNNATDISNYKFGYALFTTTEGSLNIFDKFKEESTDKIRYYPIKRKVFNQPGITKIKFYIIKADGSKIASQEINITGATLATGNLYKDAQALQNAGNDHQLILDIISYYAGKSLTPAELQKHINKNPFLKQIIKTIESEPSNYTLDVKSANDKLKGNITLMDNKTGSQSSSSFLGTDVTKYANALADIMIEHAKEELTIAFFDRFKKFIEENEEFRILFPKTTEKLQNLLSYKYPEMLKALQKAFQEDIKMITYRIDDVFVLPKYQALTKKHPEIVIAIRSLRLIQELENGDLDAYGVLNELVNFKEWKEVQSATLKNVNSSLQFALLINQSVSYEEESGGKIIRIWYSTKELAPLFHHDEELFKIYAGLIYEQSEKIPFFKPDGKEIKFSQTLSEQSGNIFFFRNKIQEFTDLTSKVKAIAKSIKEKKSNTANEDRYNYITTSIDIIEYGFSLYKFFDDSFDKSDDYIGILRLANDIHKNIFEEKYNAAISNTIDLYTKIARLKKQEIELFTKAEIAGFKGEIDATNLKDDEKKKLKRIIERINYVSDDLDKGTIKDKSKDLNKKVDNICVSDINELIDKLKYKDKLNAVKINANLNGLLTFIKKAKPFALFMANMVEAKTEADVKAALDAVILPVGSSTIKKNSNFNFNVQSYLGARLSFTDAKDATIENTWNDKFALSAPIGLSISHGLNRKRGSLTLFIPLLDLGAIVDYKLKYKNEGEANQELESKDYTVKLGQIISPGAYFVYGFPFNIPLSLGFGGQYGPGLSKIDQDNATKVINPYWKWNVFLSVDIPLFNLANNPKSRK